MASINFRHIAAAGYSALPHRRAPSGFFPAELQAGRASELAQVT